MACSSTRFCARAKQPGEDLEQRSIEEAHADNGVEALRAKWKCAGIGYHSGYALMTPDGRGNGTLDEVDHDDRSTLLRKRRRVTSSSACNVDDETVRRKRKASFDHPGRRRAIQLVASLGVTRLPIRASVVGVSHR